MPIRWPSVALLLLAAASVANAAFVEPREQVTVPMNDAVSPETPPDIALDQPPLARTVRGYEPDGLHIMPWKFDADLGAWEILVSWQTGDARAGPTGLPLPAHDPTAIGSVVRYTEAGGSEEQNAEGSTRLVYEYKYGKGYGDMSYQSPILHHVLLRNLTPASEYTYSVGSPADGFSEELTMKVPGTPGDLPLRIAVIGDPGQTNYSLAIVERVARSDPDVLLMLGDMAYAGKLGELTRVSGYEYYSNGSVTHESYNSDQRRWDAWARMMQPLASRVPMLPCHGNHELEQQLDNGNLTCVAYNARYPTPQNPDVIATQPNHANTYLNTSFPQQFVNSASVQPNNSYYSVDLPGAHLITLSNYMPYAEDSEQYQWLLEDLASLDRDRAPWLLVQFHTAPRQTYVGTYKEVDDFMSIYEPIFYQNGVDAVFGGHAHAYERSFPLYNFTVDWCGPMYICVGDGGTMDGMSNTMIDSDPQPYCDDPAEFTMEWYQPTPSGQPLLTFQNGTFCPTEQPPYSAYREPSYGYGMLSLHNATHASWAWYRNQDPEGVPSDVITIIKNPDCPVAV